MKRYLGDILVQQGFIKPENLQYALDYQIRKLIGSDLDTFNDLSSLLHIARARYNLRKDYLIGKILKELKLASESTIEKALKIQEEVDKPLRGSRLSILKTIVERINSTYNLVDILNQMMIFAARVVGAESSSIVIYDHEKEKLVIIIPSGPKAEFVKEQEIPIDKGIVGWVYRHNKPLIVNDAASDPRFYDEMDRISGYQTREILCVPLSVKGKLIGVVEVINKTGKKGFNRNDQVLLEIFAAQSAIAIENTRLYYELKNIKNDSILGKKDSESLMENHGELVMDTLRLISQSYVRDLKASLVPINGYIELIEESTEDSRVKKYGSFIKHELYELTSKTNDILKYSSGSFQLAKRKIPFSEIIEQFKSITWSDSRLSQVTIDTNFNRKLHIIADPDLMVRALIYLFRNSLDAMPRGGIFGIDAYLHYADEVAIIVWDTGQGVDISLKERIFEPFATFKKKYGSGLGLTICKKIIESHGGKIELLSGEEIADISKNIKSYNGKNLELFYTINGSNEPEVGAAFKITLPI